VLYRGNSGENDAQAMHEKLSQLNTVIAVPTNQKVSKDTAVTEKKAENGTKDVAMKESKPDQTKPSTPSGNNDPSAAAAGANGAPAPFDPVKAIKEFRDKVAPATKERYPLIMPVIKMNLRYKPMEVVTKAPHYFKYVPSVYVDALNFDFADRDYEIIERDKVFVRDLNAKISAGNGMVPVSGSA